MEAGEKRKHRRIVTKNLFSHTSLDKMGRCISQGMGKALDVSQTGVKLETSCPIEADRVSLVTVDVEDRLIEIKGKPVYSKKTAEGVYHTGISFVGSEAEIKKFAMKLVRVYHHRKHKTLVNVAA